MLMALFCISGDKLWPTGLPKRPNNIFAGCSKPFSALLFAKAQPVKGFAYAKNYSTFRSLFQVYGSLPKSLLVLPIISVQYEKLHGPGYFGAIEFFFGQRLD